VGNEYKTSFGPRRNNPFQTGKAKMEENGRSLPIDDNLVGTVCRKANKGIFIKKSRNKYRNANIKENFYQSKDRNTLARKVKGLKFFQAKIMLIYSQRVNGCECGRKTFTLSFHDRGRQRQIRTITHTFGLDGSQRDIRTNFTLFFIKILFSYCAIQYKLMYQ
jgi:hypothetical protein